jgi:RNA polymerase sigma factor (sigma-70 family)
LTVVARNLCLDWARSRFGRKQLFSSIRLLATLDREIFKCIFHRGFSLQQSWIELRTNGFDIAFHELEERTATIQKMLTSRQLWLLSTSNPVIETLDPGCEGAAPLEVRDPSPSPEDVVLLASIQKSVAKALLDLDEADRLLIRLRFYRGLSLIQVADLVGLKDAQTADRRIRDALEKLRKRIRTPEVVPGKHKSASV